MKMFNSFKDNITLRITNSSGAFPRFLANCGTNFICSAACFILPDAPRVTSRNSLKFSTVNLIR